MTSFDEQLIKGMKNLKYVGKMENPTFVLESKSKVCGDTSIIYILFENGVVESIKYEHLGCSLNCLFIEEIISKLLNNSFEECRDKLKDFSTNLSYPNRKQHCLDLALDTFNLLFQQKSTFK